MLAFWMVMLVLWTGVESSSVLSSSSISTCLGEDIVIKCTESEEVVRYFRWLVIPEDIQYDTVELVLDTLRNDTVMTLPEIGTFFYSEWTSFSPLCSTLTITNATLTHHNGATVKCASRSTTQPTASLIITIEVEQPEIRWLEAVSEVYQVDNVAVTVEWESSSDEGGQIDFYYVTVTPLDGSSLPSTTTTNKTTHLFTVPYNSSFNISVVGSNCVGNSSELVRTFTYSISQAAATTSQSGYEATDAAMTENGDTFQVILSTVIPSIASLVILGTVAVAVILLLVLRRKRDNNNISCQQVQAHNESFVGLYNHLDHAINDSDFSSEQVPTGINNILDPESTPHIYDVVNHIPTPPREVCNSQRDENIRMSNNVSYSGVILTDEDLGTTKPQPTDPVPPDRLPVVNLDSLLSKLQPQVASKWCLLGIAVGMPKEMLYDLSNCSKEEGLEKVIEYWLKTHEGDLTWREVAEKMREIRLEHQAKEIENWTRLCMEKGRDDSPSKDLTTHLSVELSVNNTESDVAMETHNSEQSPLPTITLQDV